MKQTPSNYEKLQISQYIKNKIDISYLIKGLLIQGLDLSNSIISKLEVSGEDISSTNFSNAIIGKEGETVYFNNVLALNCCFKRTRFVSTLMARHGDFRGSDFTGAYLPYADYRYADLRNCIFCDSVFTIGTKRSWGAKIDEKFLGDMSKFFGMDITIKSKELTNE